MLTDTENKSMAPAPVVDEAIPRMEDCTPVLDMEPESVPRMEDCTPVEMPPASGFPKHKNQRETFRELFSEGGNPIAFAAPEDQRAIAEVIQMSDNPDRELKRLALAGYYGNLKKEDVIFAYINIDDFIHKFEGRNMSVEDAYNSVAEILAGENIPQTIEEYKKLAGLNHEAKDKAQAQAAAMQKMAEMEQKNRESARKKEFNATVDRAAYHPVGLDDRGKAAVTAGMMNLGKTFLNVISSIAESAARNPSPEHALDRLALDEKNREAYDRGTAMAAEGVSNLFGAIRKPLDAKIAEQEAKMNLPADWFTHSPGVAEWLGNAGLFLAEQAPSQIAQILLARGMGGGWNFAAVIGATTGIDKFYDLEDASISPEQRFFNAGLTGIINSGGAWILGETVMGKLGRPEAIAKVQSVIWYYCKSFGVEAGQEAVEQLSENAVDLYSGVHGDSQKMSSSEIWKHLWNGVPESAFAGGVFSTAAASFGVSNLRKQNQQIKRQHQAISNAENVIAARVTELAGKENPTAEESAELNQLQLVQDSQNLADTLKTAEAIYAKDAVHTLLERAQNSESETPEADLAAVNEKLAEAAVHNPEDTRIAVKDETARLGIAQPVDVVDAWTDEDLTSLTDRYLEANNLGEEDREAVSAIVGKSAEALWKNGHVVINASVTRPSRVPFVIAHELLGHDGIRRVFGSENANQLYKMVWAAAENTQEMRQILKSYNLLVQSIDEDGNPVFNGETPVFDEVSAENQLLAAEEYLARLAETGGTTVREIYNSHKAEIDTWGRQNGFDPHNLDQTGRMVEAWMQETGFTPERPGFWKEIANRIRTWLRMHGWKSANTITDDEILTVLARAAKAEIRNRKYKDEAQGVRESTVTEDVRFSAGVADERTDRFVKMFQPIVGAFNLELSKEECAKALADKYDIHIDPKEAYLFARLAVDANRKAQLKRAAARRDQWIYDNNLLYAELVDFAGSDNFFIKPSRRFLGGEFSGSFISPEFVKNSRQRPQREKESDRAYQNYLKRRMEKLDNAPGVNSDEVAMAIARKTGRDAAKVEQEIIDYFRDLKRADLRKQYTQFRQDSAAANAAQERAMREEWLKIEANRIQEEAKNIIEKGEPISLEWIRENHEIYVDVFRLLFGNSRSSVPAEPGQRDLETINAALQQSAGNAAVYVKAYEDAQQNAYREFQKQLADFREKILTDKADAIRLQKDAEDFAVKNLPKEARGEFIRAIVGLLDLSNQPNRTYPDGHRTAAFNQLLDDMIARASELRRSEYTAKIRDLLNRYRISRNYKGIPISKVPAIANQIAEIGRIVRMSPEALVSYNALQMQTLANAEEDSPLYRDAMEKAALVQAFGNLEKRPANDSEAAFDQLQKMITGSKTDLMQRMEERLKELKTMRDEVIDDLAGGVIDMRNPDAAKYGKFFLHNRARLESILMMTKGRKIREFAGSFQEKMVHDYIMAQNKEMNAMRLFDGDVQDAVERIFGYRGAIGFGKFLKELRDVQDQTGIIRKLYTAEKDGKVFVGTRPAVRAKVNWRVAEYALAQDGNKLNALVDFRKVLDNRDAREAFAEYGEIKDAYAVFLLKGYAKCYTLDAKSGEVSSFEVPIKAIPAGSRFLQISDVARNFAQKQIDDCSAGIKPVKEAFGESADDALFQALTDDEKVGAEVEFVADPQNLDFTPEEMKISRDAAIQLLLTWEQPFYRDAMRWNGFDESTIEEIKKFLGPKYVEFAHWMRDYVAKDSVKLDAAAFEKYGVRLPAYENYWPGKFGNAKQEIKSGNGISAGAGAMSMNPAFLIARRGHLKAPNVQAGALETFMSHVQAQEHFLDNFEIIGRMRGVFNDANVKRAINQTLGQEVTNDLLRRISEYAAGGGLQNGLGADLTNKLTRFYASSKLVFSLSSMCKQAFGAVSYMYEVPVGDFVKYYGKALAWSKDFRDFLRWAKNSDYFKTRIEGGLDKDLVYMLNKSLDSKHYSAWSNMLVDMATMPMRWGDAYASIFGGYTAYASARDRALRNGATPAEAREKAEYAWMRATDATQQSSKITDQSAFMSNASALRLLTLFRSNPTQTMDLVLQTLDEKRLTGTWKGSREKLARKLMVSHLLVPSVMFAISQAWRHGIDFDDWDWEELGISALFGSIEGFIFGSLLLDGAQKIAAMVEGKGYYSSDKSPVPVISDATDAVASLANLVQKDELEAKDYMKAMEMLGNAMMPVGAVNPAIGNIGVLLSGAGMRIRRPMRWFEERD